MDLLERMKQETKPLLIIAKSGVKTHILKRMREEKIFHPVRFMSKEDLFQKVFFEADENLLHHAAEILDKKPDVVKPLLRYLYTVDERASYRRRWPKMLKDLKLQLKKRGVLWDSRNADAVFSTHKIIVSDEFYDPLFDIALEKLKPYDVERVSFEKTHRPNIVSKRFATLEEEIRDVMISIRRLEEKGVPFSDIAIVNAHNAYHSLLLRMKEAFSVPLNGVRKRPLYAFPTAKRFLEALDGDASDLYEAFKKAFEELGRPRRNMEERIVEAIRTTVNPLVRLDADVKAVFPYIVHLFKRRQVTLTQYTDAVECTTFNDLNDRYEHVFIVGTHEGHFPVYTAENDLLDKADREEIGFPLSEAENTKRKQEILDAPARFANVTVSFSEKSAEEHYSESHVVASLKQRYNIVEELPHSLEAQPYSKSVDMLHAKALYDDYALYGKKDDALEIFRGLFEDELGTYDNRFSDLHEETLRRILPEPLQLSYTKLNAYFECPFRFYIEHLLSIEETEETMNMVLGRFFHSVLETTLDEETLTDERLEEVLQEHLKTSPTAQERFYLERAKEAIKTARNHIRRQHQKTNYETHALEGRYEKSYLSEKARVVGVIDKVLRDQDDYALIDYKSTKPTFDLRLAYYGMSAQLLVYMLLFLETAPNAAFTGFYEQTILHNPFKRDFKKSYAKQVRDFYKLRGYTVNDLRRIERFDPEYETDPFIDKLRTKKDGTLRKTTKQFASADLRNLLEHMDSLLEDAFEKILSGRFDVSPWQDDKGRTISCEHCPFSDVCYRRKRDYRTVDKMDDADVFKRVRKEGE